MPLKVRLLRQLRTYSCLPTCVRAVRSFFNEELSDDDASEICDEYPVEVSPGGGCDWDGALIMLSANYSSVQVLNAGKDTPEAGWEQLRICVEDDKFPAIAHVWWLGFSGGRHAVVVCGVHSDHAEIMNPGTGCVEDLTKTEFLERWRLLGYDAFYFTE